MKFSRRRAVSPIIASLLLIAIAVAAGIIVYVYVNSLAGGLTSAGGNQVSQQIELQAYNFNKAGTGAGQYIDIFLKNVGSSSVSISQVYIDGTALSEWGTTAAGVYAGSNFVVSNTATSGCYMLIVTTDNPSVVTAGTASTGTAAACVGTPSSVTCGTTVPFCIATQGSGDAETGGASGTTPLAAQASAQLVIGAAGTACSSSVLFPACPATAGTTHTVKIVTTSGGQSVFTIVAGRTG